MYVEFESITFPGDMFQSPQAWALRSLWHRWATGHLTNLGDLAAFDLEDIEANLLDLISMYAYIYICIYIYMYIKYYKYKYMIIYVL